MFVGREDELGRLEKEYRREGSWTFAVFGRRRVGKSELLREFCKGKPHVFLTAPGINAGITLQSLSDQITRITGEDPDLKRAADLIAYLESIRGREKTVVVLDEFPELVKACPEASPLLQAYVDHRMREQNLMLILCGSSISAMGRELNGCDSPLFGRFLLQMRVEPLPYRDARRLNPGLDEADRVRIYAIASGIPPYHALFGGRRPADGIKDLFMGPVAPMILETENVVSRELSPGDTYVSVLSLLHGGASIPQLKSATGMTDTTCTRVLSNLMLLGFVRREVCFGTGKKSRFRLRDGFLGFRYGVLPRCEGRIAYMDADEAFQEIKTDIDAFYGPRFEDVCAEYVLSTESVRRIGSWWGTVPVYRDGRVARDEDGRAIMESTDIDLVAVVRRDGEERLLLGECKFTGNLVGRRELDLLMARGRAIKEYRSDRAYILFSRSGFTNELTEYAEQAPDGSVKLVSMDDIRDWAESVGDGPAGRETEHVGGAGSGMRAFIDGRAVRTDTDDASRAGQRSGRRPRSHAGPSFGRFSPVSR